MEEGKGIIALYQSIKIKELLTDRKTQFSFISEELKKYQYLTKLEDETMWKFYSKVVP